MQKKNEIDLTEEIWKIIYQAVWFTPLFSHIDPDRVTVCIATNRAGARGAVYGKLVPLRFKSGAEVLRYRGNIYRIPEVMKDGVQQLYLIYFYMTRFFDLSAEEKARVIFHELFHISTDFNGDIRRFGSKKVYHGHSTEVFNTLFKSELEVFMEHIRKTPYIKFLEMTSDDIYRKYEIVSGRRMKVPRPEILNVN